jgi:glycosyltransferase involved in cell wall biosynthesis
MRIGVDAVPFAFETAGVGRYLGGILEEMQSLAPTAEFLLYSPVPIDAPLCSDNCHLRVVAGGLARRPSIWAQIVLPGLLAADGVDAYWSQPTNLPIVLKRRCFRVLTVHDLVPYVVPKSMRFWAWLRTRVLLGPEARTADVVVADSHATASQAHRYLRVSRDRMSVVYPAAPSWCRPVQRDEAKGVVAREFELRQDYVLFVSTIEPRKDHLTLLRAIEQVPDPPLLVIAGGRGWRSRRIFEQIRAHEKSGRVRYVGRVDDQVLPALYSGAKFSVYPSTYEGFGLPVLESMACGCPVLSSDSSSLPEVGGDAARYFRAGDATSLSEGLRRLLWSESELSAMAEAGFVRAALFSYRRAAAEILQLIRDGLARKS